MNLHLIQRCSSKPVEHSSVSLHIAELGTHSGSDKETFWQLTEPAGQPERKIGVD